MFFELSKFLNFFLISPISWIFLLLIVFCLCKKKRWKRIFLVSSIAIFIIFTNKALADYVKFLTAKKYSAIAVAPEKRYKLAIVMGGFASMI